MSSIAGSNRRRYLTYGTPKSLITSYRLPNTIYYLPTFPVYNLLSEKQLSEKCMSKIGPNSVWAWRKAARWMCRSNIYPTAGSAFDSRPRSTLLADAAIGTVGRATPHVQGDARTFCWSKPLMVRVLGQDKACRILSHFCIDFEFDFGRTACE